MVTLCGLSSVRCLGCGSLYAKPERGGTAAQNPGCPRCGYVGWIHPARDLTEGSRPLRFAWDRQLRRSSQSD